MAQQIKPTRDINDALDELRADVPPHLRKVGKRDLLWSGVTVVVAAAIAVYELISRRWFGLFWAYIFYRNLNNFWVLLQKYQTAEEIMITPGIFFYGITTGNRK
jgi:hypothetical protein